MESIRPQDIVDQREALGSERSEAYQAERARIDAKQRALEALCESSTGHCFAKSELQLFSPGRKCLYCWARAPRKAEKIDVTSFGDVGRRFMSSVEPRSEHLDVNGGQWAVTLPRPAETQGLRAARERFFQSLRRTSRLAEWLRRVLRRTK